jgi:hypothetical protein
MSKPMARRLVAVAFGVLLALAIAELLLRLAGARLATPRLPLSYDLEAIDGFVSAEFRFILDPELGWANKADANHLQPEQRVRYHHNHEGLRAAREYTPVPTVGVRRLSAHGDSYTYCEEVDLDDCWTHRLEWLLPRTEVLNYGVPAYAPDQAWLRYQRDAAPRQSCAVLIGHTLENIKRIVNRFRPFMHPDASAPLAKPRFILEQGRLVLVPNPVDRPERLSDPNWVESQLGPHDFWYFPGVFVAHPLDRLELVRLIRTQQYQTSRRELSGWSVRVAERLYQPGTEPMEVTTAVLLGFARQVRADGATPIVLLFPTRDELVRATQSELKPHAPLLEALQRADVPVIDLTDALGTEARQSGVRRLLARGSHYSAAGNTMVAETLARVLPGLTAGTCPAA